eukprot:scaffold141_cov123-Isochrysis_galbana.AAC.6
MRSRVAQAGAYAHPMATGPAKMGMIRPTSTWGRAAGDGRHDRVGGGRRLRLGGKERLGGGGAEAQRGEGEMAAVRRSGMARLACRRRGLGAHERSEEGRAQASAAAADPLAHL